MGTEQQQLCRRTAVRTSMTTSSGTSSVGPYGSWYLQQHTCEPNDQILRGGEAVVQWSSFQLETSVPSVLGACAKNLSAK
eukprot:959912-Pyramimonas_sp.AAC.1